jgi:Flp pilus assembly protein TadG
MSAGTARLLHRTRCGAQRRGTASIEAALGIALVLIPLVLGVSGVGMALMTANRLDQALQAAVFYAWANPGTPAAWSAQGSSAAAAAGTALAAYGAATPAATVTASVAYYCVSGGYTQVPPAVTSTTTCPSGQSLATYLTVTATASVISLGAPLPAVIPLVVSGTVRVL